MKKSKAAVSIAALLAAGLVATVGLSPGEESNGQEEWVIGEPISLPNQGEVLTVSNDEETTKPVYYFVDSFSLEPPTVMIGDRMPDGTIVGRDDARGRRLQEAESQLTGDRILRRERTSGLAREFSTLLSPPAESLQFAYDPAMGAVSAGDVWRVKNGDSETPSRPSSVAQHSVGRYGVVNEQGFRSAAGLVSTFSLGVDTASYSNIRRFLTAGSLPPHGAIRIEEMVNYFTYDYPEPEEGVPFTVSTAVAECPWNLDHRLVRIGVRTRSVDQSEAPPANLVFLVDVSGSMSPANRLPLVQQAFRPFINELTERDRVSIVVYAGEVGLVLDATPGDDRTLIRETMDGLVARGSTRGGEAIQTAYRVAHENFIEGGINRIILATDGDFNVGTTDIDELTTMITREARNGVSMTILGVGTNINDQLMERVSRQGNATYHYLDTVDEGRRVLVEQIGGTLVTVAEDFKAQAVFNPELVESWRLVGYDTRQLPADHFDRDDIKAGDIGAGLTSTILYQVILKGTSSTTDEEYMRHEDLEGTDEESRIILAQQDWGGELARVQFRYKNPGEETSNLLEFNVRDEGKALVNADDDFVFAAAVAGFGMLLRNSEFVRLLDYNTVALLAESATGGDPYREELVKLIRGAESIAGRRGAD